MRHAFRQLVKSPGFTIIAIVTLALGIGLNTSMFSLMNLFVLRPVPFPEKDQLVRIYRTTPQTDRADHTAPDFIDLTRATKDVIRLAAYRPWGYTLVDADRPPVNLNAMRVSADFFPTLGLKPELGRFFTADEDKPGNHVIIISHATWQAQFAGDPDIIGRTVRIDGEPTTVVGVLPATFSNVFLWGPGDAFRPLAFTDAERVNRSDSGIQILGRYKPDQSLDQLNAQLRTIATRLAETRPPERKRDGLNAVLLQRSAVNPGTFGISLLLLGLAGFVLLIACANLANLQLARTVARSQEFAIRAALGASRIRLLQPVVMESLLLATAGGGLGILVAVWANAWISSRLSANGVVSFTVSLDWRVLSFAFAVSAVTGLLFGLVPASLLSQVRVNDTLKSGTRGNTGGRVHHRFRHSLIVIQFALALMLLTSAALFIRGFNRLLTRDNGWDRHSMIQGVVNLPQTRYRTAAQLDLFYTQVQERLAALPGVEHVAIGWTLPIFQFLTTRNFVVEGREPPAAGHEPMAFVNGVTPSFLPTLKIKLLAGRNFTEADNLASTPVVMISESMARALFPNENPVGHRLGAPDASNRGWAEIVGVIPDLQYAIAFAPAGTGFLVLKPIAQEPWGYISLAVRGRAVETLAEPIRRAVASLDPNLAVQQLNTVDGLISSNGGFGMINTILTAFALLGLFLASLGLYGVITRLVIQRTPEIGVRIALGAQPRDVLGLILNTGLRLSLIGTVVGFCGAFGLTKVIASFAPNISVQDPLVLVGVSLLLMMVAFAASWLPARRATRIDPLAALRAD